MRLDRNVRQDSLHSVFSLHNSGEFVQCVATDETDVCPQFGHQRPYE